MDFIVYSYCLNLLLLFFTGLDRHIKDLTIDEKKVIMRELSGKDIYGKKIFIVTTQCFISKPTLSPRQHNAIKAKFNCRLAGLCTG